MNTPVWLPLYRFAVATVSLVWVVLNIWLVSMMVRRKVHKLFRFLFFYVILGTVSSLAFLPSGLAYIWPGLERWYSAFPNIPYFFWIIAAASLVLGLIAVCELFPRVFSSLNRTLWWAALALTAVVMSLGGGAFIAAFLPRTWWVGTDTRWGVLFSTLPPAVGVLQIVFCTVLWVRIIYLGIRIQRYPFGISIGLGMLALVNLLPGIMVLDHGLAGTWGRGFQLALQFGITLCPLVAIIVWLVTFGAKPERKLAKGPT